MLENKIRDCLENVYKRISTTQIKKFNIFLSLQIDKSDFTLQLCDMLREISKRICIVTEEELELQRYRYNDLYYHGDFQCLTLERLISIAEDSNDCQFDTLILVNERAKARAVLLEKYPNIKNSLVFTIATPALSNADAKKYEALGLMVDQVKHKESVNYRNSSVAKALVFNNVPYLMYELDSILDIRDLKYAVPAEQETLKNKLIGDIEVNRLSIEETYKMLLDRNVSVEEIAKKQLDCISLLEIIRFLQDIISSINIDHKDIIDALVSVQRIKAERKKDLDSKDSEQRKEARLAVENAVAERILEITKSIMTISVKEQIEAELEADLTKEVWNKLTNEGKNFLVTAVSSYDMLIQYMKKNDLGEKDVDFSGVCLLLSKALELELCIRVFTKYQRYIKKKFGNRYDCWPKALLNKNNLPIDKERFTLGSVRHIMGMNVNGSPKMSRYGRPLRDYYKFTEFAVSYNGLYNLRRHGPSEILEHLELVAQHTAEITKKYRNRAAHKEFITITEATECKEYMLEIKKSLKLILEKMEKGIVLGQNNHI